MKALLLLALALVLGACSTTPADPATGLQFPKVEYSELPANAP